MGCIIADDFEAGIAASAWESTLNAEVIGDTPGLIHGKALWFGGSGTRSATTLPANVRQNTTLRFSFRAGNPAESTNRWEVSEAGEGVVLEYSTNTTTWTTLVSYNTTLATYYGWNSLAVLLPSSTWTTKTQFRWRQFKHSGAANDTWALDDVCLEGPLPPLPTAPPFVMATPNSSRAMALWWVGSVDAREYVVERASGTNGWMRLATTGGGQTWFTDTGCMPSTTYAYRLKAVNAVGSSPYSTVVFGTTISQITEWQVTNLGSTSMPITAAGSDGIPMLLRFAFNMDGAAPVTALNPENPVSGAPVVEFNEATGNLEILFLRRKAQSNPGIVYDVEFSDDLKKWIGAGSQIAVRSLDDTWELARYADSSGLRALRFGRVAVRLQEQSSP